MHYTATERSRGAYHAVEIISHRNMVQQSSQQAHHNYSWQEHNFSVDSNLDLNNSKFSLEVAKVHIADLAKSSQLSHLC